MYLKFPSVLFAVCITQPCNHRGMAKGASAFGMNNNSNK